MDLTRKEILKELEEVSERMARGWDSQWTLKEIYQMILALKVSDDKRID